MILKPTYLLIILSILFGPNLKAVAGEIEVASDCLVDDNQLVIFTLLDIDFKVNEHVKKDVAKTKRLLKTTRQIWKINCSLEDSICSAAIITIDKVERGEKLTLLDMILPDSIRIAARTEKVFTLFWGPFTTLTVDTASGRVDYRESGPDGEGRGVAYCH
jgi:hypothetical protein